MQAKKILAETVFIPQWTEPHFHTFVEWLKCFIFGEIWWNPTFFLQKNFQPRSILQKKNKKRPRFSNSIFNRKRCRKMHYCVPQLSPRAISPNNPNNNRSHIAACLTHRRMRREKKEPFAWKTLTSSKWHVKMTHWQSGKKVYKHT